MKFWQPHSLNFCKNYRSKCHNLGQNYTLSIVLFEVHVKYQIMTNVFEHHMVAATTTPSMVLNILTYSPYVNYTTFPNL